MLSYMVPVITLSVKNPNYSGMPNFGLSGYHISDKCVPVKITWKKNPQNFVQIAAPKLSQIFFHVLLVKLESFKFQGIS